MSTLKQAFQSIVADNLRPLPVSRMPHSVYELLARFEAAYIAPACPSQETTFAQIGFRDGTTPSSFYLPLEESQEWVPCTAGGRQENWTVFPLRDLTHCERFLPAIGSAMLGAGFPTHDISDSLWRDTCHHFQSAAANIRAKTVGLGLSTVAIPGAHQSPTEWHIRGQMMKLALIKY